jgi:hypothetical protein
MSAFMYPAQSPSLSQLTKLTGIITNQNLNVFSQPLSPSVNNWDNSWLTVFAILAAIGEKTGIVPITQSYYIVINPVYPHSCIVDVLIGCAG